MKVVRHRGALTALLTIAVWVGVAAVACGGDEESAGSVTPTPTVSAPRSPTPIPDDFVATITIDADPTTPEIDRGPVQAKVGDSFQVAVVVRQPPEPYQAYQFGLYWRAPVLGFVEENKLKPDGFTLCPELVFLENTTGIYSGCINVSGTAAFEGQVSTVTLRCEQPGDATVRLLTLVEANEFGVALLREGGEYFATDVDTGIEVTCA